MEKSSKNIILACAILAFLGVQVQAKLKLVNVVFRHGDRAPDNNGLEMYPKDPYINDEFNPMKLGGLTNNGKLREYHLGEHLRKLYSKLLGNIYYPKEVSARSTNVDRTKMSLQLVLAALYPPNSNQKWNNNLDWQPIPTNYVPTLDDNLMVPEECPKYLRARERVEQLPEVQEKKEYFQNFTQNLTNATGREIINSNDMYFLYHALMAEQSMNLTLPEWTKDIFPYGDLLKGTNLEYEIASYNDELKRLNGGMMLRRIIENMEASINEKLDPKRKIFLYSGHETNVAALLQALGVYTPHVPEYTSAVFIELHEVEESGNHYVNVKYYKGIPKNNGPEHETVTVPGCYQCCLLDQFKSVLKNVIPSDEDIKCDKRSLRSSLLRNELQIPSGIIKQLLDAINKEDKIKGTLH